ncbi:unnamed protein product [Mucor hiemalis]
MNTMQDMKSLSPMYSFRFQESCYPIKNGADTVIANNQQDQRLLVSLNRHPESLRILHLALKCKDTDELDDFNFGKVPVSASDQERCLLRTIRYTLQDFVPISFDEIFDFMQVFELITYLQVLVLEQEQVDKILRSEHTGITDVGNKEIILKVFANCKLDFEVDINVTEPELVGSNNALFLYPFPN